MEILIADQSNNTESERVIKSYKHQPIRYIKIANKGKSYALNQAIRRANKHILAFTDDDCIVSKRWLTELYTSYQLHPKIVGVFGNVFPYKPNHHLHMTCPATFHAKKMKIHRMVGLPHYHRIGLGNNMSFRKDVFRAIGYFKPWLGPGNRFQGGGEESDIIFRVLSSGYLLETNPRMIVYHNRWLTPYTEHRLQARYTCGLIAFESYYLFGSHHRIARRYIKMRVQERILYYSRIMHKRNQHLTSCVFIPVEIAAFIIGMSIGIIHRYEKK